MPIQSAKKIPENVRTMQKLNLAWQFLGFPETLPKVFHDFPRIFVFSKVQQFSSNSKRPIDLLCVAFLPFCPTDRPRLPKNLTDHQKTFQKLIRSFSGICLVTCNNS